MYDRGFRYIVRIVNNGPDSADGASLTITFLSGAVSINVMCANLLGAADCPNFDIISDELVTATLPTLPSEG